MRPDIEDVSHLIAGTDQHEAGHDGTRDTDGYLAVAAGDTIYGIDLGEETKHVVVERNDPVLALAYHDDALYDGGEEMKVYDTLTGDEVVDRSKYKWGKNYVTAITSHDDRLYHAARFDVSDADGRVMEFNEEQGPVNALVSHDDALYAAMGDGVIREVDTGRLAVDPVNDIEDWRDEKSMNPVQVDNVTIDALGTLDDELYAGAWIDDTQAQHRVFMRPLTGAVERSSHGDEKDVRISALGTTAGAMYAGYPRGRLSQIKPVTGMATLWQFDDPVHAIEAVPEELYDDLIASGERGNWGMNGARDDRQPTGRQPGREDGKR